ncbi:MAG: lipopolysaccharide heptosyltransferase I, partial [Betaproteobacteria bacterium]
HSRDNRASSRTATDSSCVPHILLVKTSSMGDVVHNLPVVADLRARLPDCRIDWIVERAFSAIPGLHPGVDRIIPVSIRHWRKHPFAATTRHEIAELRKHLRQTHYDDVIDSQGLLKSALLTWMARGRRHGFDWKSSREPLQMLYDKVYEVSWSIHAVERNRCLAARALGYAAAAAPDYGLTPPPASTTAFDSADFISGNDEIAVLLHATSAATKEWPEANWIRLGADLAARGLISVLPFGNARELERSERLVALIAGAKVPPALSLQQLAALMSRARIVVGVDTGLTHLAVALGRPTIGVYCATDPAATGLYGAVRALNLGSPGTTPSAEDVCSAITRLLKDN